MTTIKTISLNSKRTDTHSKIEDLFSNESDFGKLFELAKSRECDIEMADYLIELHGQSDAVETAMISSEHYDLLINNKL